MEKNELIEINGEMYIKKTCVMPAEVDDMPYVIIRTYSAGVFAGYLKSREGKEVVLKNARRIWYWKGAASLSQLAREGTKNPMECKFPCAVEKVVLTEAIEVLYCTAMAKDSIEGVHIWEM
jgi:hypothetical protein